MQIEEKIMFQMRFSITILFMFAMGISSVDISISGTKTEFTLENASSLSLTGSLKSGDLSLKNIDLDAGSFTYMQFQGFHQSNTIGSPELPEIHKLIEIPQEATPRIEIIKQEYRDYYLEDLGIQNTIYPCTASYHHRNTQIVRRDQSFMSQLRTRRLDNILRAQGPNLQTFPPTTTG